MRAAHPSRQTLRALDAVNFLMADVQTGVGPFLAVYLASERHWDAGKIGFAMFASGITAIAVQTPAGAIVDRMREKRGIIAAGAVLVALGSLAIIGLAGETGIVCVQSLLGVVGAFFPPAMAGTTLGIVGQAGLDRRIGRNETCNHLGNVFNAVMCGFIGHFVPDAMFGYVAFICLVTAAAVFFIRGREIDFDRARGCADGGDDGKPGRIRDVLADRPLLIFVVSAVLFHFANAAMLPLIGERLSQGHEKDSTLAMMVCIVGAQAVMVPVALVSGRLASRWGRKAVFLAGFGVLPLRGVLYTLSGNAYYLVGVQLLDGIGAGVFGVVSVLIIADLTRGTGRFNFTLGAVATATGIGASLSNGIAGAIAKQAGFNVAFLFLAAIAAAGLLVFLFAMPETKQGRKPG